MSFGVFILNNSTDLTGPFGPFEKAIILKSTHGVRE